ncbi:thioesterase superfamily, partial [uncultured Rubrobacteraceae bacterium]
EEPAHPDAARDPLRGPRPLRPRQQRRLPGVLREDPSRLLARRRGAGRHRRARSRRRPRRPLRNSGDHRQVQGPDLLRRRPARSGADAYHRQPLLHHGLRAAHRRDLRERHARRGRLSGPRLLRPLAERRPTAPRLVSPRRSETRGPPRGSLLTRGSSL